MTFNVVMVIQKGRLAFEAVIALASLTRANPHPNFNIYLAEPQPGPNWNSDPRVNDSRLYTLYQDHGAILLPFDSVHFGEKYPHGNKIECLSALPAHEPFLFLDTDTLVTGNLNALGIDFTNPTASLRRSDTWPKADPNWSRQAVWQSLYDRFSIPLIQDTRFTSDDWQRFPYYNAGWFFGACPHKFGAVFTKIATAIWQNPGPELAGQSLIPWLDQVALPLAIADQGGCVSNVAGLDDDITCHYRNLSLLFARESAPVQTHLQGIAAQNKYATHLQRYPAFREVLFEGGAQRIRQATKDVSFEDEASLRKHLKSLGLWFV